MTPENYEKLRGKILAACPELETIGFGCEVLDNMGQRFIITHRHRLPTGKNCWGAINSMHGTLVMDDEIRTVIGHPIRIPHVLRALAVETIPAVSIDQDGWLQFYPEEHGVYYNLEQDDLALQSDEVKEFLFNLLTPKTDE